MTDARAHQIFRWVLPVASTGILLASWGPFLDPLFNHTVPPYLYFLPVLLSGAFGGLGPAFVAALLSCPLAVMQYNQIALTNPIISAHFDLRVALYLIIAMAIAWLSGRTRDAVRTARKAELEARRDRQLLMSARDQLAQLTQVNLIGVVFSSLDGAIIDANGSFLDMVGYQRAELGGQGLNWKTLLQKEGGDQLIATVLRDSISVPLEATCLRKDGTVVPVLVRGALLRSAGQIVAFVVDLRDQKTTEKELKQSRRLLAQVADATPDLLFVINVVEGRVQYVNQRVVDLLGLAVGRVQGFGLEDMAALIHPGDIQGLVKALAKFDCEQNGAVHEMECRMRNSEGVYRVIRMRAVAFERGVDGKCREILGLGHDVTEAHAADMALRLSHERMEAANMAKDQFLAGLSHELRTPLNPVLGLVSIMESDAEFPARLRDDLHVIKRNVELEARLIDDLLDLTRISNGKMKLNMEMVRAHEKVQNAVQICREDLQSKGIELKLELMAEKHSFPADAARCQQVVWNLLKNAVKFTPEGGMVTIRTSNPDEQTWRLEVEDTGVGIPSAMLPRIFDAFEQAGRHGQFGGLGLGLAISKAIVDIHGGRIMASSGGQGKGAMFRVDLPIAAAAKAEPAAGGPAAGVRAEGLRVMLVEDHADTARVMERVLRGMGHQVLMASNVSDAVKVIHGNEFDLLISDIGLPDGTGLDVVRAMRAVRKVPSIAVTGFGMEADIQRSREAGFDAHVTKPVDIHRLADLIGVVTAPVG